MCDCDPAIDALEMAVWNRTRAGQVLNGLVHDRVGALQYLSIRYSERLAENDIVASVGSRADSYDTCNAEAFNSPYKWELGLDDGPRDCHGVRACHRNLMHDRGPAMDSARVLVRGPPALVPERRFEFLTNVRDRAP
jgi:putative transposase